MSNGESSSVMPMEQNNPQFQANVSDMTRYMRFMGMYYIIVGAISCIGIVTAVFGVPVIFMGMRLRESAEAFTRYVASNAFEDIAQAVERQTRFFFINYVLLIVGLVIAVIYIIVMIAVIGNMAY